MKKVSRNAEDSYPQSIAFSKKRDIIFRWLFFHIRLESNRRFNLIIQTPYTKNKNERNSVLRFIVHLLGAISSGKGHTCKLLQEEFKDNMSIIGLGALVRDRLQTDDQFRQAWGQHIGDGHLLPDEVVCPMLNSALLQPLNRIVVIEGFDRTPEQIDWSKHRGLIGPNSIFFRLNATEEVCRRRHHHRNQAQPDGKRTDTGPNSFHRKYSSFVNHIDEINKCIGRLGNRVITIDANGDIPTEVFPQIKGKILEFTEPHVQPHIRPLSTPREHVLSGETA